MMLSHLLIFVVSKITSVVIILYNSVGHSYLCGKALPWFWLDRMFGVNLM